MKNVHYHIELNTRKIFLSKTMDISISNHLYYFVYHKLVSPCHRDRIKTIIRWSMSNDKEWSELNE